MFLYGIGIQFGRQFFAGLKGPGLTWNVVASIGVLGSLGVATPCCSRPRTCCSNTAIASAW